MTFKNVSLVSNDAGPDDIVHWMKQHPYWCIKPFQTSHLSFSNTPQGEKFEASPCCNYSGDFENLTTTNQQYSKLKYNIVNGISSSECQRCYKIEETNDFSERIREVIQFSPAYLNNFVNTGKLKDYTIGIRFGNFCNLACRSCSGAHSSTYAKVTDTHRPDHEVTVQSSQWNNLLTYTKQIVDDHDLVHVGLIGGETMIQPGAVQFTDFLSQLEQSKKIVLRITSNFTTLNKDILKHIDQFLRVDLTASIDSTGKNYHYVRWPAQFDKIKENIKQYQHIRKSTQALTTFSIASVFSLNNIFYIEEYIDFLQECIGQQHDTMINVLHLDNPDILSIQNLPLQYRLELLPYIQRALQKKVLNFSGLFPMKVFLQGVETFLNTEQIVVDKFDKFLEFTANFDQRTHCDFSEFNTRLYNILTETDKNKYLGYLSQ